MVTVTMKTCKHCGWDKPLAEFYAAAPAASGDPRWQTYCKLCTSAKARASTAKAKAAGTLKQYKYPYTRETWEKQLMRKFGMTGAEYDAMLAIQGGVCAICGLPCPSGNRLAVDHDHACCPGKTSCGKCIRSLLCMHCNSGLGCFRYSAALMLTAAEYLFSHTRIAS